MARMRVYMHGREYMHAESRVNLGLRNQDPVPPARCTTTVSSSLELKFFSDGYEYISRKSAVASL